MSINPNVNSVIRSSGQTHLLTDCFQALSDGGKSIELDGVLRFLLFFLNNATSAVSDGMPRW